MIAWYWIPLIGLIAYLNHFARGQGNWPRYVWYIVMCGVAWIVTGNPYFSLAWLSFLVGYAAAPWQAMLSGVSGMSPLRDDHWAFQWMQEISYEICNFIYPQKKNWSRYFFRFGIIYGVIRALLIFPSVAVLVWLESSWTPLLCAIPFLAMGYVYYISGQICRRYECGQIAVALAEIFMGYMIGTYFLICAGIL